MKILHTSDLHLGKRLYHIDLLEDQELFLRWTVEYIECEKVDLLLISGDIFDVANPSSEARRLYYQFLVRLSRLRCKIIITGGNHDSPAVLEAPRELLESLDIHVVGARPEELSRAVIPVTDTGGRTRLVVAAVPFLRDRDLRAMVRDETYDERLEAIRRGIAENYREFAGYCRENYPDIPALAMGHLFVSEGIHSESERDVQVGNQAGVDGNTLPGYFSYYAMGHLHTPQEREDQSIYYPGSPYPLSFSERENHSRVLLLSMEGKRTEVTPVEVPVNRRLIRLTGTLEEVKRSLDSLEILPAPLPALIELEVVEQQYNPQVITDLETLEEAHVAEDSLIIKSRVRFARQTGGTDELYSVEQSIEDLSPRDVFLRRMENEELPEEVARDLSGAFDEILEIVLQEDE